MARALKEWVGKTPDTKIPNRVRQRVYDRFNGICHICKGNTKGKKWHVDHVKALIKDIPGEPHGNRESNLAPAHDICNLRKAAEETAEKAAVDRIKQKHSGARQKKKPIASRNDLRAEPKPRKIDRAAIDAASIAPKRRALFG
jgi:5-methylcytosine-specific restriction endonuclease McrA